MRRAAELMPARLFTIEPEASLADCDALFRAHDIRHLPVVAGGALVGVVHEEDVAGHGVALAGGAWSPRLAASLTAGDVARPCAVRFAPEDPLVDVIRAMLSARADVAVAEVDGQVAGLITDHDAVWAAQWALDEAVTCGAVASRPLVSLPGGRSVADAWAVMAERGLRHLLVSDEAGALTGIVSRRDLVAAGGAEERGTRLAAVARSPFVSIEAERPLACAATRMAESKIGCVPVLDGDDVVGVVTRSDLARHLCDGR